MVDSPLKLVSAYKILPLTKSGLVSIWQATLIRGKLRSALKVPNHKMENPPRNVGLKELVLCMVIEL